MARKSFPLRIDTEIHQALETWAADELRSVNGHIEYVLRQALKQAGRLPNRGQKPEAGGQKPEDEGDSD